MGKELQNEAEESPKPTVGSFAYSVDHKDLALVNLLRDDARRSYAELGGTIGLSADAVRTRLNRLISTGYVRLVTLVD
ncbi:Lrp/AsnC family transcriptional regulator, partial [Salinicola rhizosphaerae]